jgi:hypothetical protein
MPTLSAAIVRHRVASMRDVEEALARQALYGGDLATNLLEVSDVSEGALTEILAGSLGLKPAPEGELPRPSDRTLRLVPAELAERHSLYPLEERSGTLVVAVSEPLPLEVEADLGFALGLNLAQRAAPLVRVRQAIARDYQVALTLRFERLLAKLDGLLGPSPFARERGSRFGSWPLPGAGSVPPVATGDLPETADGTSPLVAAPAPASPLIDDPGESHPGGPPTPRVRWGALANTYGPSNARQDISLATSRDQVLSAFFDLAAQYFEYSVLFMLQGDQAHGRDAHGPGLERSSIARMVVPLGPPSALRRVKESGQYRLVRLGEADADGWLARELGRSPGPVVLFLPVTVRNRCVLVFYGDQGNADVELDQAGEVLGLLPVVSAALERLILERKRSTHRALVSEPPPLPDRRPSVPPAGVTAGQVEAPERLVSAEVRVESELEASSPNRTPAEPMDAPPEPAALDREPVAPPPGHAERELGGEFSVELATAPVTVSPVRAVSGPQGGQPWLNAAVMPRCAGSSRAAPSPVQHASGALEYRLLCPQSPAAKLGSKHGVSMAPVVPIGDARTSGGLSPGTAPSSAQGATNSDAPLPLMQRGGQPTGPWRHVTPRGIAPIERAAAPISRDKPRLELVLDSSPPPPPDAAPEVAVGSAELEGDWVVEDGDASPDGKAPLAPVSRYVQHGARAPCRSEPSRQESSLPSIIVDMETECTTLVERLLQGDETVQGVLVEMGEPAARALAARLPGPVSVASRSLVPSRSGPLLAALVYIGAPSVPIVSARTTDTDPTVRAWATRVLGELPWPDSARAVAERFCDEDEEVRRAALGAGRMLAADQSSRRALREALLRVCGNPGRTLSARRSAAHALGDLREQYAIPTLIALLDDEDHQVAGAAHQALVALTAQDFGPSRFRYTNWWETHSDAHRIEWLIDALTSENATLRRAAGEELKAVTKEYFGYYDDLPPQERAAAQGRYREWWNKRGRALFGP